MWSFTNKVRNKIVSKKSPAILVSVFLLGAGGLIATADNANRIVPPFQIFADPDGAFATLNLGGPTDTTTNPFFQDLGSNGRRCVTCHQPSDAWSVTPPHVQARFAASNSITISEGRSASCSRSGATDSAIGSNAPLSIDPNARCCSASRAVSR